MLISQCDKFITGEGTGNCSSFFVYDSTPCAEFSLISPNFFKSSGRLDFKGLAGI